MRIWMDFTNTPHVNFFLPIIRHLKENQDITRRHDIFFTARDFSETFELLKKNKIDFVSYGKYRGKSRIKKVIGYIQRSKDLLFKVPDFDYSISQGGLSTVYVSMFRRRKSIIFGDNDLSVKWPHSLIGNHFFFPKIIPIYYLNKMGYDLNKVIRYDGFKEDMYIADYKPSKIDVPIKDY
jgi:hypothetical protein